MRLLTCFTAFALIGFLVAAPTSNEEFVIYKAEHDVVKLIVPINGLNMERDDPSSFKSDKGSREVLLFFVEADVQPDGSRVEQGLYVLKDGKAKKILDYGRDAAASRDNSTKAFFGAKDGLYVYNYTTNSADKYGPIKDSIIAIDVEKNGEVIYILTEDRELYKVTKNGEKKVKLDDVVKPKEFVLDYENNLYFFSNNKKIYVRTADGIKQIEGLPESIESVTPLKPPIVFDNGVLAIVDNQIYAMYPNGTSETTDYKFKRETLPTAMAIEGALVQYYASDKKIYEYNILAMIFRSILKDIFN